MEDKATIIIAAPKTFIETLFLVCIITLFYQSYRKGVGNFTIFSDIILLQNILLMTERELIKLEATIRNKMDEIKKQRVSLRDSGIGGLMNALKKVDEALYDRILPEYKKMVADYNIFK